VSGRWYELAWQHVGELWYLHRPGSAVPSGSLRTPTGHGLSVGESRDLIKARDQERGTRRRGAVRDHAISAYFDCLEHLLRDGRADPPAGP
jgi:hypothetical protein